MSCGMGDRLPCLTRYRSAIFGKAEQIEVIVVVGENGFSLVPEVQKELNVARRAQHRTGVKFMCIRGRAFDFIDQGFPHTPALMGGMYREQPNDADAGHGPEAHGTDDRSFIFSDQNVLLLRIFFQALESLRCPAADGVDRGILAEGGLLYLEDRREIGVGRWSNVYHGVAVV